MNRVVTFVVVVGAALLVAFVSVAYQRSDGHDEAEEQALAEQLGLRRSAEDERQGRPGPYVHRVTGREDQHAYAIGYYKCYRDARSHYQQRAPEDTVEPYELAREFSTDRRRGFDDAAASGCYEGVLEGASAAGASAGRPR